MNAMISSILVTPALFALNFISFLLTAPLTIQPMPFDPVEALRCVCLVSTSPYILVVRADSPARDIAGFHAMAKAQGAKLNYGSAGNGTPLQDLDCDRE